MNFASFGINYLTEMLHYFCISDYFIILFVFLGGIALINYFMGFFT